jgi:flagellar hook-associated protein 3 FlgL
VFNTHPESSADGRGLKVAPEGGVNRRLSSESVEAGPQNTNLFQQLKALRTGLLTGDLETVRGTLDTFDDLLGKVISTRSKIGARIQSIEGNMTALDRHNITNAQLTSSIEDADMTQVVSDLAKEETVFKSSLASSKHLIQPTLLDFLR